MIVLLVAVSLPVFVAMGAFLYGPKIMGWGFHSYPKTAALVCILLVAAVFAAALSFNHFFPGCGYRRMGSRLITCDPSLPRPVSRLQ